MSKEWLHSEDVAEYRREEIKLACAIIKESWQTNFDPVFFKGQMDMLNQIVKLPVKAAGTDKGDKAIAQKLVAEALTKFEAQRMRDLLG